MRHSSFPVLTSTSPVLARSAAGMVTLGSAAYGPGYMDAGAIEATTPFDMLVISQGTFQWTGGTIGSTNVLGRLTVLSNGTLDVNNPNGNSVLGFQLSNSGIVQDRSKNGKRRQSVLGKLRHVYAEKQSLLRSD